MICEIISQLNANDREQVVHLLAISFPVEYSEGIAMMSFFIDRCPGHHFLLVRTDDGLIIGVICLLDREMNYDGLTLVVTGCSYMAVHPDHRNFSVSAELSKLMFSFQEAHSDVSLGFARRAMDNYWFPFGFTGITNFGNVVVDIHKLPAGNKLSLGELEKTEIFVIAALHNEIYVKRLNSLSRSLDLWNYMIDKLEREHKKIQTIKTAEGELVGYLLRYGNTIEELGITDAHIRNVAGLIRAVFEEEEPSVKEVNLKIGITHPFSRYVRNRGAHSVNTRFAWNGGHIFRINNIADFF
jgi:predicted N-acetyltransferase YhbS